MSFLFAYAISYGDRSFRETVYRTTMWWVRFWKKCPSRSPSRAGEVRARGES